MAFGDQDFATFFSDFTEPAVIGGFTVQVFVDMPASPFEHGFGSIEEAVVKLTVPITAFTALPIPGVAVSVRGVSYTIARRCQPGDGRIVELELKRA